MHVSSEPFALTLSCDRQISSHSTTSFRKMGKGGIILTLPRLLDLSITSEAQNRDKECDKAHISLLSSTKKFSTCSSMCRIAYTPTHRKLLISVAIPHGCTSFIPIRGGSSLVFYWYRQSRSFLPWWNEEGAITTGFVRRMALLPQLAF